MQKTNHHTLPIAPATQSAAKPRTRTETLPKLGPGVTIPDGYVPAYFRKRHGLLVLRTLETTDYLVFSIRTGEYVSVKNTKEASKLMAAIARGLASLSAVA